MITSPTQPKIYHITHVDNLPTILSTGGLVSDAEMIRRGGPSTTIGMFHIKKRRVEEIEVDCHPGTKVGDYVPFYFCPRSVMLFLIDRRNHELAYKGGQGPIVHFEADLGTVISWAQANQQPWAFSLSNAGACYAQFRNSLSQLHEIDWEAVVATQWSGRQEKKQAEFLLYGHFPWHLVACIGVQSRVIQEKAWAALSAATHQPPVEIMQAWYY